LINFKKGGINKSDDKEVKEDSNEWINCAGSSNEDVEEFLIDSGATCHETYKDQRFAEQISIQVNGVHGR